MTVRVERTFEFDAPAADVWAFISDPENRARPISVVTDFEVTGDRSARWHVRLPIPLVKATATIETEEVERREGEFVKFVGRSNVLRVQGEHELADADSGGSVLHNRFVVEGKAPGVESYFKRNLDDELRNLEAAIRRELDG